ncbi:MAG: hypothetical protein AAFQ98_17710, partial [Bacteroidota bacterium]
MSEEKKKKSNADDVNQNPLIRFEHSLREALVNILGEKDEKATEALDKFNSYTDNGINFSWEELVATSVSIRASLVAKGVIDFSDFQKMNDALQDVVIRILQDRFPNYNWPSGAFALYAQGNSGGNTYNVYSYNQQQFMSNSGMGYGFPGAYVLNQQAPGAFVLNQQAPGAFVLNQQ